ncbi:microcin C ABC transporter permease YejB [Megalodesulfovibrio gigas]|uniref:Putative binding-protein-dependent transport system inner membrane protein n=1 Tax=Megalodesulfovibrio gigas (strain ATCC 19364 / DSM 1382 / NCIMB 9332 / VKM B-1759) TaxID=1121448 RepID=T2GFE7_MEGG1|nr:microcin C ABC transporter permease YejB [Megalodesulfovibrio gigas]AGW14617.1 putative binding-protein-dependent transport system inner membrane protein [Megalodesulfovibrio gigas DSM 1382 = ATCC 19364]
MLAYILRRLLLLVPTLFGIVTLNFFIIQVAPGGPVEQFISTMRGAGAGAMERVAGSQTGDIQGARPSSLGGGDVKYRGAQGLDPAVIKDIEKLYGFDKPLHVRYLKLLGDFLRFDLGRSFFRDKTVLELIAEKLPVSISLGLWATLIIYMVSIPLGVAKAVRHGSRFDIWTSAAVILGNAIPAFLFAILLVVLFAGGSYFKWFPLRGLTSPNFDELSLGARILDYFWHLALPVTSLVIGSFAALTLLTKNSFLEEIGKQYVVTARAKGLTERSVLYGHVFRNAMLIVVAGFPAAFIGMFFTGSLLIEVIFSLNGLGLMGYEALLQRDYPVIFGTLYIFTLLGMLTKLVTDLTYTLVDPRIDFEGRG